MRQAIHIFLKDARHWRWLIVLQLVLLGARTAVAPGDTGIRSGRIWENLPGLLDLLLPIVWWFTIALIVYDEPLDVDSEFWITRPYSWRSLAAAKALFVGAFVLAPLLIADIATLSLLRFSVRSADLLWFEFCRLVILAPFALLAAVTRGIRHFLLGLLLIAIFLYAAGQVLVYSPVEDQGSRWGALLFIGAPVALVVWSYAQRRIWLVRGVIAALLVYNVIPGASSVSSFGVPHPEIGVRFAPDTRLKMPYGQCDRNKVCVALPIAISGRERNLIEPTLVRARIQSGGTQWETSWNWYNGLRNTGSDWLVFAIPSGDYDRLKLSHARVEAEVALTIYDLEKTVMLRLGDPWRSLGAPGQVRLGRHDRFLNAEHRLPLYDTGYKLVYQVAGTKGVESASEYGTYPRNWSEFHISPVLFRGAFLGNGPADSTAVLIERPIGRIIRTLTIGDVPLEEWTIPR